ncbi:MAG TPA: hypothetical protein VMT68_15145 [Caulobacteraceae bacterium]|nr:hypothetical protein [Caulobacteraceae bacterium]
MRLGVVLAVCLAALAGGPAAFADAVAVDARAEVAAALFSASATQAAALKADDVQLRAARTKITALAAQVKAGDLQHRRELASAEEGFVAQLAEKDRAYAQAIEGFRSTVTDIAATPEGAAALARFNNGDEAGALTVLDQLQAADEAARQKVTDIEKAVGERRVATLALEARNRGKVDTASVIARFEAVVRLDPGVLADWIQLDRLDRNVGHATDALKAVQTAASLARTDRERSLVLEDLGAVRVVLGDLAGARKAYDQDLEIARQLAAASPKDLTLQRNVGLALYVTGQVAPADGNAADAAYDEAIEIARRVAAADAANNVYQQDVAAYLMAKGDVLGARRGDLAGAQAAYEEALRIMRGVSATDPDNVWFKTNVAAALEKVGDVDLVNGNLAAARDAYGEELATDRAAAAADPGDAALQRAAAAALDRVADVALAQHDLVGARAALEAELTAFRKLAAADPENASAQHDLGFDLAKLADVLAAQNDMPDALQDRRECLSIARRLAAANPANAGAQRDLAVVLARLAQTPNSEVHWRDVVDQLRSMQAHGQLTAADAASLQQAQQLAAKEAGR